MSTAHTLGLADVTDSTIPLTGLGQLGAVGVVLAIFLWFGWKVYTRERDRADKNWLEVQRLNQLIVDKVIPSQMEAAAALRDSQQFLQEAMRERRSYPS